LKHLKTFILMFGLVLLTACSDSASKFVGEWVDPNPKERSNSRIKITYDITIKKASESNRVEITSNRFGEGKIKEILEVDGNNIIDPFGGVEYTLEGDELVSMTGGPRLVRKK